ncbi:hypothetical protein D7V93_32985 [Corallococcus llansteffanensis]|uniref:Tetratricopeptide repeat protein n=2 Tax=Corallococcus llansteffanensis TaxID=2316731 RepID=A0A3A8P5F3_9BACT|nr:hypothetical protein D7V93_32985 [Corallococcus llansteffanensis]
MLGVLYARINSFQLSEMHYETFLVLAPPDHPRRARVLELLNIAAAGSASSDTAPQAPSVSNPAEEETPRLKTVQDFKSLVNQKSWEGDLKGALKTANTCAEQYPSNPECQLMLGVVNAKLGRVGESRAHYEKFLELAPERHIHRSRVVQILGSKSTAP